VAQGCRATGSQNRLINMTMSAPVSTRPSLLASDSLLYAYLLRHEPPEHEAMSALRAETGTMTNAFMQIGPEQAHLMAFLVKLLDARHILEVGTFTGYSALAMALALPRDGQLITCDINESWARIGRKYWERAGVAGKIDLKIGPAIETMEKLKHDGANRTFDVVFIDANKDDYDRYYEAALCLIRSGGLVILDNMLFRGRVADLQDRSLEAITIRELNVKIAQDERVDRVMLPIGDGMTLVRYR
jgi:O-methyltransferase